jgi:hypothetical protein
MFCGWRLINSYRRLVTLGPGTLEIDALTAGCWFNGVSVEPLSIAWELHFWLKDDLVAQGLPVETIRSARLEARLELSEVARRAGLTRKKYFGADGQRVDGMVFHRCAIACRSELVTDETVYSAQHEDIEEWPVGWPSSELGATAKRPDE